MTEPAAAPRPSPAVTALVAFDVDLLAVLVFAFVGRRTHEHGLDVAGVLSTAWPFAVGLLAGWLVARAWRRPLAPWSTGLVVWAFAWGLGMALRAGTGGGTAPAFVLVALGFLGLTLVGWRAVATLVGRRRTA
ncbi:DUF3054 domain-containing protein [Flavimobilis sp. GY10621]|uniref:DUF3054 domain-containing protein n=1 Tax=Flavimobilis rhizosphaerae TaxID=2775421 RepID=A0ABR9DPQ3_9MICO|nr:DUF3054 domain-containing protein [Flavimobilis rhizosphaerae]MBD9699091.1 DUF3054 domain-containing protein [Flavimobilis rhizosphaerae]